MKRFFFLSRLGGDSPELLNDCSEKERMNSGMMGATLLLPVLIWSVGGAATAWMMGGGMVVCLVTGGVCGGAILIADRGMMAWMSRKGRSPLGVVGRLVLALAGSTIFAHPGVFLLGKGVIERELEEVRQQAIEARKAEITPQLDAVNVRLGHRVDDERAQLAAATGAVISKDGELAKNREQLDYWRRLADAEGAGKRSGIEGFKQRWQHIMDDNVAPLAGRERVLQEELEDARKTAAKAQESLALVQDAVRNDPDRQRLEHDLHTASEAIRKQNFSDPLSRYEALHKVMARQWATGNYSLGLAYGVGCLFLLGLELLPLGLKLGGRGEHVLKVEELQFKAEQDFATLREVYPELSMQLTRLRLQAEARREEIRLDYEAIMDRVRASRQLARSIMLEKAQVFEMAADTLARVPRKARAEHREFAEVLTKELIESFLRSVESAMRSASPRTAE